MALVAQYRAHHDGRSRNPQIRLRCQRAARSVRSRSRSGSACSGRTCSTCMATPATAVVDAGGILGHSIWATRHRIPVPAVERCSGGSAALRTCSVARSSSNLRVYWRRLRHLPSSPLRCRRPRSRYPSRHPHLSLRWGASRHRGQQYHRWGRPLRSQSSRGGRRDDGEHLQ